MQNNDLDNTPVPRLVLVFEGALGFLIPPQDRKFAGRIRRHHWEDAAFSWTMHELYSQQLYYLARHHSVNLDVVTFAGPPEFGEALKTRLQDYEELPVHDVWATTVPILARKIAYMADLGTIYDPDPSRSLTWGGKGFHITQPSQLGAR